MVKSQGPGGRRITKYQNLQITWVPRLPYRDASGHVRSARAIILEDLTVEVRPNVTKPLYASVASYTTRGNRNCVLTRFTINRSSNTADTNTMPAQAQEALNTVPQLLLDSLGMEAATEILATFIVAGLEQDLELDLSDIPDEDDLLDFASEDDSLSMISALQLSLRSEMTSATTGTAKNTQSTRDKLVEEQDRLEQLETSNEALRQQLAQKQLAIETLYARMNLHATANPTDSEMTTPGSQPESATSPALGAEGGGKY